MIGKLSAAFCTGVLGLGVVAAVATPTTAVNVRSADVSLTATALIMGGANGGGHIGDDIMLRTLAGRYANDTRIAVDWPAEIAPVYGTISMGESTRIGADNLEAAIREQVANGSEPVIAVGLSQSSEALDEVMRRFAADPAHAPSPDQVSFVVLGDADRSLMLHFLGLPTLPLLDYAVQPVPVTPYNVTVVAGEYDGFADFPDRWWNILAVANAAAGTGFFPGFGSVHEQALYSNLNDVPASNITTSTNSAGGVTTKYVVPTADLPLLRPLPSMGVPQNVVDQLNVLLRPIVDSAYVRNDPRSVGSGKSQPVTAASVDTSVSPAAGVGSAKKAAARAVSAATPKPRSTPKATGTAGSKRQATSSNSTN
ncbi:PE-PPE domain-containing protein [Mycolicibacterium sp. CH28]|uniref:PE-PPE domain-containing protein n=1 Tax=Mycolicibacterium sp. CH28 TaxID=2512237 RepID=UPI0010813D6A|nr:PE-PPE domain-containing protein [Mycolicibacterium sp. CH28]TGD85561.1 PE-PPE domain-containing protein [Mycolicibacterium sp. CH28]